MKLRVYMNDWSTNMGIIGFLNILNEAELSYEVLKKDNYIEFDSELLEHFEEYYFDYFMKEYDMSKIIARRIEFNLNYLKKHEDKLKDSTKNIKENIKKQADKVKKFDEESFNLLKEELEKISKIKRIDQYEELEKICSRCIEIFKLQHINEKLTLNLYKYIVGDNYFGQVSFFNVNKSNLDLHNLKKVMYQDYLIPIIYYCRLADALKTENLEEIDKFIKTTLDYFDKEIKLKHISKSSINNIYRILKDIDKKFIKKEKSVDDIKLYLHSLDTCNMCGDIRGIVDNYTESNFAPLAVSADNAINMYWDMNINLQICSICKLILFCTPAGATLIRKKYIQDEENEFYSFVNLDTSIEELFKNNSMLRSKKDFDSPFQELIIDIVGENKKKSEWQLSNILFIEFKASVSNKKCKMNYFDMPNYLAKFFSNENSSKKLNNIKDTTLKSSIVDILLKQKDLKNLISQKLREKISNRLNSTNTSYILTSDIYKMIKIRYIINYYKEGGNIKMDDKKLESIRREGRKIHDYYVQNKSENKIDAIAYKLLNTAKVRNKKDFTDTVLRLFISSERSIPIVFLNIMSEKELDFESIAYAFISGLISEKYEGNNKEVK